MLWKRRIPLETQVAPIGGAARGRPTRLDDPRGAGAWHFSARGQPPSRGPGEIADEEDRPN